MAQIVRQITADVVKRGSTRSVYAKQNDLNSRFLKVTIQEDGTPMKIESTSTVMLNVERSDAAESIFYGTVNDDGSVQVPLTPWMLALEGTLVCDVSIVDADGAKLTTMQFNIYVEPAVCSDESFVETEEYNVIIDLLNRADLAASIAEDALAKSNEANSKYAACVEATRAAEAVATEWQNEIDKTNARLDELIAMRPVEDGILTHEFSSANGDVYGTIRSNGTSAHFEVQAKNLMLTTTESSKVFTIDVPAALLPIGCVVVEPQGTRWEDVLVRVDPLGDSQVRISIRYFGSSETILTPSDIFCGHYSLASIGITEVFDIRDGYDGTKYDTAGDAVRAAQRAAAAAQNLANGLDGTVDELLEAKGDHEERITKLEDGGGLPKTTTEDNDKVLTVVNGEPQWALHAGISNKQKVVFADDGEGNVSIVLVDDEQEDSELEGRVDEIETTLYGAATPDPVVETVTVTNLVTNPHFGDGMNDWTALYTDGATTEAVDGELRLSFPNGGVAQHIRQRFADQAALVVGHHYYMSIRAFFESGWPYEVTWALTGTNLTVDDIAATPLSFDGWSTMSRTSLLTAASSKYCSLFMKFYTQEAAVAMVHIDDAVVIDLTAAFGEGNEPDHATMDRWMQEQFPNGFEGAATLALTSEDSGEGDGGLVDKVGALEREVNDLADTVQNSSISAVAQTGTVYPVLESYYIDNIEEARPEYYNAQAANTLTFAVLADIHSSPSDGTVRKNVEASSAWAKLVNHDFVVLAGDLINDSAAGMNRTAAMAVIDEVVEMTEKHARCPVFTVKGNHDTNELATGNENRLTDAEFYLHANARGEKHGMVTDPAHPYGGYYYVDFPRQKIRMVCLNTSENYPDVDIFDPNVGDGNFRYIGVFSPNQMAWIKDTALRVDAGWAVMMVSHIPPFNADNFNNRGTPNPELRALCEAFAAGEGDFGEQGKREFIGHFCGHAHVDAYNEVGGLNYVIVNCTYPHPKDKNNPLYLPRTANEDKLSLNSFIIDRATHTVKCIKIGAKPGDDYLGRWVDSFTWEGVTVE